MLDFKKEISNELAKVLEMDSNELEKSIEVPKEKNMGDYAFPCFRLAKTLKKAPQLIANEINEKLEDVNFIEKREVVRRIPKFLHR